MKCPVHSEKDVVGYCMDCGVFGCEICLTDTGKGERICGKCGKVRHAADRGDEKKGFLSKLLGEKKKTPVPATPAGRSSVARRAGTSRKLVVYFKNKRILKGTTYKLDIQSPGFFLIPTEPTEQQERIFVHFSDLKAIHSVRDFEGKSDPHADEPETPADGNAVKAAFADGEIVEGRTIHHFDPACQRFFIVPNDSKGNILSILVERSALKGLEIGDYKHGSFAEEEEALGLLEPEKKGRAPLSQNESMGDLYFSMKNYDAALTEYEKVRKDFPDDRRLALKISICNFNRGVNFIKSRKYLEAKAEFEKIGEDDPIYEKARKKTKKIEKILREAQRMGP
ncbi:MAG: hypothetical protein C4520_08500 [Candidatus Abyssobacteria bacterium SURF_5]|uniref:Tetratricopeptide repeat protein n=1 Tax=Abyssobacteria bacterium (strain SURF_5) TaxID=2093360 RepID=A0A3A4NTU7_ABYX5|nr:MAG: hypothetical protein C4520_08500 [Candidatus Abyssubacteria bacterium SURF_5]